MTQNLKGVRVADNALHIKQALSGSPLRKPAHAAVFAILLLVLLAIGMYNLLWPLYGGSPRMIQTFAFGALIAIVLSLPAIALVWFLDRREHEWPFLLISAALWGAVVSASLSTLLGTAVYGYFLRLAKQMGGAFFGLSAETVTSVLAIPVVEEIIKGIAILLLFWLLRGDFDDLRDGIIYGAMVGLGFNAAQYAVFLLEGFAATGAPPYLSLGALQFVFFGVNGHFIYSALLGAGFGLSRQMNDARLKKIAPLVGLALAILANILASSVGTKILNDIVRALTGERLLLATTPAFIVWLATALSTLAAQFWAYILLAFAVHWSEHWEVETIRRQLFSEVGVSVTPDEYVEIEQDAPFKGRTLPGYPKKIATEILDAQDELAYRKWRVEEEGGDVENDELVRAWREHIAHLRTRAK
jgi:RsiW-degrading membrane proteinase PrsW (M82 family)